MGKFKRHVTLAAEQDDIYPLPGQKIVRVIDVRGSNIIEIEYPDSTKTLVNLPSKFQRKLWVRRGTYVIIDDQAMDDQGGKVTGMIIAVLYPDHVKKLRRDATIWPAAWMHESKSELALSSMQLDDGGGPSCSSQDEDEEEGGRRGGGGASASDRPAMPPSSTTKPSKSPSPSHSDDSSDNSLLRHGRHCNRRVIQHSDHDTTDSD